MKFDVKWRIAALIVGLLTVQPSSGFAGLIEDLQNAGQADSPSTTTVR